MMSGEFNLQTLLVHPKLKPPAAHTMWQELVKWMHYVFEQ